MTRRNLRGATVVLTGASSGIGRAAAYAFARQGANLVLAARREHVLAEVAAECCHLGGHAVAVPTDVSQYDEVERLAQTAVELFGGRIDVWINNAGVGAVGAFVETPIAAHEQVIRTNLLGYLYGAHAVLPYFLRQRSGVLINVNSEGGWVPAPYAVAYTASKFGLRGFSESLRGELSRWQGIHVCDIFPAFIDTPGIRHAANYTGRELQPLPPLYDPHDVAAAMVSLAQRPRPAVTVGQAANVARLAHFLAPGFLNRGTARLIESQQRHAQPAPITDGNLFAPPSFGHGVTGGWRKPRRGGSMAGVFLVAGLAAGVYLFTRRTLSPKNPWNKLPTKKNA